TISRVDLAEMFDLVTQNGEKRVINYLCESLEPGEFGYSGNDKNNEPGVRKKS
ncbi:hypothetical protein RUM43_005283, partial [Polyplax serrata]